jgi:hypothetical protein
LLQFRAKQDCAEAKQAIRNGKTAVRNNFFGRNCGHGAFHRQERKALWQVPEGFFSRGD